MSRFLCFTEIRKFQNQFGQMVECSFMVVGSSPVAMEVLVTLIPFET